MKRRIDCLRQQLDDLVRDNADFQEIYKMSVRLDSLIATYYKRKYLNGEEGKKYAF